MTMQIPTLVEILKPAIEQGRTKVLDIETTLGLCCCVKTGAGPSPFNTQADLRELVAVGVLGFGTNNRAYTYHSWYNTFDGSRPEVTEWIKEGDVVIGHNIKFDLLWLLKEKLITVDLLLTLTIIDTSIVEYRKSGHTQRFPSLSQCADIYGVDNKLDKVKEFWEAGVDTHFIPRSILMPYLRQDCLTTKAVFNSQLSYMYDESPMILIDMDALKSSIIIEYNGMCLDNDKFQEYYIYLSNKVRDIQCDLLLILADCVPPTTGKITVDGGEVAGIPPENIINSEGFLKYVLYNTEYKLPVIQYYPGKPKYKTGKRKGDYKTKKGVITIGNPMALTPDNPLSAKTIAKISTPANYHGTGPLLQLLADKAHYSKELSTYFKGMAPFISKTISLPTTGALSDTDTTFIHGNLNHTATVTGRLSSSKPNLQNISGKDDE